MSSLVLLLVILPHLLENVKAKKPVPTTSKRPKTRKPLMICPTSIHELKQTDGYSICKQGTDFYLYNTNKMTVCRDFPREKITALFKIGMARYRHGCPRQVMKDILVMFEKSVTFAIPSARQMPMPCDSSPCLFGGTCKDLKMAKKKKKQGTQFRYWCKCLQPGHRSKDSCQRCAPGRYGFECRERCGDCANPPCNYTTGDCPQGKCASEELRPPKCTISLSKDGDQPSTSRATSRRKRTYHAAFDIKADTSVVDTRSESSMKMLKFALAKSITDSICEGKPSAFCADIDGGSIVLRQNVVDYYEDLVYLSDYLLEDDPTSTISPASAVIVKPRQRSPATNTSAKHLQGAPADRTSATHRQRAPVDSTTIRADITIQIPEHDTQGRGDFAAVIATNLKQDAPNFDLGDGYTVDTNSIQVTELAVSSDSSTDSSNLPYLPMIVAVLCVAVIIAVILFIALMSLQRNTTSRNIPHLYPDTTVDNQIPKVNVENYYDSSSERNMKYKTEVPNLRAITPEQKLAWETSGRLAEDRVNQWKECFPPKKKETKKNEAPKKRAWVKNWHKKRNY